MVGWSDRRVPGDERVLLHDDVETDENYYYTHRGNDQRDRFLG